MWNPDLANAIVAEEEVLIDAYLHHTLAPELRRPFARVYLERPAGRARVALASATKPVARREPRVGTGAGLRVWLPLAAVLVLAVGGLLVMTFSAPAVLAVAVSATPAPAARTKRPNSMTSRVTHVRLTIDIDTQSLAC